MPSLTAQEVEALLRQQLPPVDQHDERVEHRGDGTIRLRLPFREAYVSTDLPGVEQSIFSGPLIMGFADTAMYACIHAALGREFLAVMVTLTITFLRPAAATDLLAEARIVRPGKRLLYLETYLYADGDAEPVGHVTATYAIRPTRLASS